MFDLRGVLDFSGGDASFNLANGGIGEFSQGTVLDANGTTYTAGVQSESYFPAGFNPYAEFGSFSSQGLVHTEGTTITIPVTYLGHVLSLNAENLLISGTNILDTGGQITTTAFDLAGGLFMGAGTVVAGSFHNDGTVAQGFRPDSCALLPPTNRPLMDGFWLKLEV